MAGWRAMAGGTWWRDSASDPDGGGGESVYLPPQVTASPPAFEKGPATGMRPVTDPPLDDQRRAFESASRSGRTDVTGAYPGWDTVYFDFQSDTRPPADRLAPAAVPEPEAASAPPVADETAGAGAGAGAGTGTGDAVAVAGGLLAGRRPAPLLLVAAVALLGGAYTGSFLAMVAGWGAAYLSRGLGDFTKKFVALGIPLATMTGAAVWYWGRARGRWGTPLAPGSEMGQATLSAGPGVLRIAAVLSALFVLAVTLRRRPGE